MIYSFSSVGSKYRKGKEARKETEKWIENIVVNLRNNKIEVEKRATLDAIHRIELEKESTKTTEEVQINQEDKKQDLYTTKQQEKIAEKIIKKN